MSDLAMLDNLLINISSEMDCSYSWGGRRRIGWDRLCAPGCGQACGLSLPLLVGIVFLCLHIVSMKLSGYRNTVCTRLNN